jgi:hypothetical protein
MFEPVCLILTDPQPLSIKDWLSLVCIESREDVPPQQGHDGTINRDHLSLFFIRMWGVSLIHAFLADYPRRYAGTHTQIHCYIERRWAVTTVARPLFPTSQQSATPPACGMDNVRKHTARVLRRVRASDCVRSNSSTLLCDHETQGKNNCLIAVHKRVQLSRRGRTVRCRAQHVLFVSTDRGRLGIVHV